MAILTYKGGALDHIDTPAVAVIGSDGRPIKRRYAKPEKREFFAIEVFDLWGTKFPKGEGVEVNEPKMIAKAKTLSCFEVTNEKKPEPKLPPPPPTAEEMSETPSPRRGRPRKVVE